MTFLTNRQKVMNILELSRVQKNEFEHYAFKLSIDPNIFSLY